MNRNVGIRSTTRKNTTKRVEGEMRYWVMSCDAFQDCLSTESLYVLHCSISMIFCLPPWVQEYTQPHDRARRPSNLQPFNLHRSRFSAIFAVCCSRKATEMFIVIYFEFKHPHVGVSRLNCGGCLTLGRENSLEGFGIQHAEEPPAGNCLKQICHFFLARGISVYLQLLGVAK